MDVLETVNEAICDGDDRPYQDVRITHTVVLEDPFPDPSALRTPARSPSPSAERLRGGRIAPDEEIDETAGKTMDEINEQIAEKEAKARATILEMVGDIPDAEMAPPENVLFVCKLNPVTSDDDLEIIFGRFGRIKSCEVIRDRKSGDSLQYAFVEFEEKRACEEAYFKMDNVLIDDRRIHVDFSQSVSKIRWLGKGRGVRNMGENDADLGKGNYKKSDTKRQRQDEHRTKTTDKKDRQTDHRDRGRDVRYEERRRNDDKRYRKRSRSRSPHRDRYRDERRQTDRRRRRSPSNDNDRKSKRASDDKHQKDRDKRKKDKKRDKKKKDRRRSDSSDSS